MSEILAIIPARGGSKGVPRKNIKPMAGKPLIAWSIEAARHCSAISRTVVTTEDAEIADISQEWGADVPFLRPPELAADETPGIVPILHALEWLSKYENYQPEWVMVLQATSPLRKSEDVMGAVELMRSGANSVVSVCEAANHPYLAQQVGEDGTLTPFISVENRDMRRQAFPPAYVLNGAIYLNKRESVLHDQKFLLPDTHAFIMPPERSIDIDTPWDFYLADLILRNRDKHEVL